MERRLPAFPYSSHFAKHKVNQLKPPATSLPPGKLSDCAASSTTDGLCGSRQRAGGKLSSFYFPVNFINPSLFVLCVAWLLQEDGGAAVRHLSVVFPARPPQSGR